MRNSKSTFTTAALSILFVLGIQHSDFDNRKANVAVANTIEQASEVDSFAIRVANYDETMQWYRENLNATVEGEWTVPQNPDAKLAYLNVYGFRLKVLSSTEFQTGISQVADSSEYYIKTTGFDRPISFRVNDVDAVMNKLEEQGVPTLIGAVNSRTVDKEPSPPSKGKGSQNALCARGSRMSEYDSDIAPSPCEPRGACALRERVVFVEDNNGNLIEFYQPL